MSSFLDILGDGHVNFEKCGDVVVSPKDNMVAMFCHFCKDIFTHLPEFMRHLQWSHSDVLQFTKEQNVYRVEELMSLETSEDDVQSQANSCSSGDSGLAGEMEDADGEPGSSECLANNLEIMNALAAFDVDVDGLNNVSHEQSYSKTPPDSRTEGFRCARKPGRVEKPPSICDLKSYNITRHSRKREAIKQRLSSVKKRIMRSLENDVISPRLNKLRSKLNNSLSSNISGPPKQSKMPSLLENSSVNELPAVLESTNPPNFDSEQPYVVSTTIKPSIRPCPSRTAVKTDRNISHQPVARRSTVNIERVDILPPINIKQKMKMSAKDIPFWESIIISSVASQQPSELNTTNNAVDQPPKRPERRSSLTVISSSPIQAMKPMRRSSMTRENTSPESSGILRSGEVESPAKANKRTKDSFEETSSSNEKGNAKRSKLEQNRCSMNFSLSASVTEYIRSDLKTSKLDLDSILRLAEPLESDYFKNTIVEDQVKNATKMGSPQKEFTKLQIGVKPEMEALKEDLRLLKTVGLLVLKDSCFEDKLPFEQSESFRKTAAKFSKIYHTYDTIWSYRKTKTIGVHQRLTEQLNSFTEEVNREIDCHLTTNEIKRILNLINSWYAYQIDQRFFRKATLSYSVEHYMFLFHFLPKINPTVYFCECCEEIFPNEARYKKHVQSVHAVHAFTCSECGKSFKRLYFYEKHLKTVHLKP
uniref:Protein teflon n=1 Tax=Drosophila pseudoobscura pseudoobscura TaxID=46245 RepID=TEF_DROPS|nr:RecName: Full=Protein teflon [Drosophila pseudoobscura pseudoobscura]AAW24439.2 Tef [Drosophila pseudoobscura]